MYYIILFCQCSTKLNVSDVDANGPYCDAGKFEASDICFVGLTNAQVYSICLVSKLTSLELLLIRFSFVLRAP